MIPLLHDSREREREKQKGNRSDLVDRRHIERWRLTSGRFQENACKSAASKVHYLSRCGTARAKTECIINSKREARPMLNEVKGQCGALARKSILTRRCSIPDATRGACCPYRTRSPRFFVSRYRIVSREERNHFQTFHRELIVGIVVQSQIFKREAFVFSSIFTLQP